MNVGASDLKTIGLPGVPLCAPTLAMTIAVSPEGPGQDSHVLTGTLKELDLS
jgi:hypothetical protein